MPYAAHNAISTARIPGAIEITDAQYLEAVAGMTSQADPRKVSVATGFKLVKPSNPEAIAIMGSYNLPALPDGRMPVNTGLARHPSGNGWLCGDDGRTLTGSTTDGGVIWYNEDFTEILANFKTIGDFGLTNQYSIQGVCAIPGTNEFWALARFIANTTTNSKVVKCNATTGEVLLTALCQNTANGIAVVPEQGVYYTVQITGEITKWDINTGIYTQETIVDMNTQSTNDMLLYLGDGKMLMTYGANGSNGVIVTLNISSGVPKIVKSTTIPGSNAMEGIVVYDGFLWMNNDGHYHGQNPALNRVIKYSLGTLLD